MLLMGLDLNRCVKGVASLQLVTRIQAIQPCPYHSGLGIQLCSTVSQFDPFSDMLCFRQVSPLGKSDDLTGIFFNLRYFKYNHLRRRAAHVALRQFRADRFYRHPGAAHVDVDTDALVDRPAVSPDAAGDRAGQFAAGLLWDTDQRAFARGCCV